MVDNNLIFIRIAAYREFDLVNTLRNCISRAQQPELLRFGICWQHGTSDSLEEFEKDSRFRIYAVESAKSKGMFWARSRSQKLWQGEQFSMQIDGHHRFAPGWDQACRGMYCELEHRGVEKPLLTTYAAGFTPQSYSGIHEYRFSYLGLSHVTNEGYIRPKAVPMPSVDSGPIPGRFFSGHFSFSNGRICEDIPTDPSGYYFDETITAARAWTHGYDLYCPDRWILCHNYTRENRVLHSADHEDWRQHQDRYTLKYHSMFGITKDRETNPGKYGFGLKRSLSDYERFAGISFSKGSAEEYTINHGIPPGPELNLDYEDWQEGLLKCYEREAGFPAQWFCETDATAWAVVVRDQGNNVLFRENIPQLSGGVIEAQQSEKPLIHRFRFFSKNIPVRWALWPFHDEKGWCQK